MVYRGMTSFPFAPWVQQQRQRELLAPYMSQGSGRRLLVAGVLDFRSFHTSG